MEAVNIVEADYQLGVALGTICELSKKAVKEIVGSRVSKSAIATARLQLNSEQLFTKPQVFSTEAFTSI